jgi:hypothetical protein
MTAGEPGEPLGMSGAAEVHRDTFPRTNRGGRATGFAASRHVNRQR